MQIETEYACLQAYWAQFIWRSNHISKSKASKMRFCACGLISYNQKGYTMSDTKTREPQQKRSIEKKNRIIEVGFLLMCEKVRRLQLRILPKQPAFPPVLYTVILQISMIFLWMD